MLNLKDAWYEVLSWGEDYARTEVPSGKLVAEKV